MIKSIYLLTIIFLVCCNQKTTTSATENIDELARQYVRLGLTIGQYDNVFVDAYYGPDSLQPTSPKSSLFPKDSLLASVDRLSGKMKTFIGNEKNDTLADRARWMASQLTAFARRIRIFSGELGTFDEESKELFGVVAPSYPESYFKMLIAKLDSVLPGNGSIPIRFQNLANRFIIPKNKLDTVFKTAIGECRKRTLAHYTLPANENFSLEYVTGKSWSGYNWYKGNYQSLIQINTDLQIFIDRAIDVGSHESYPGHHVYNMLLEKNLYREKGWLEISLYPLFSPQSLIAEGSANYGIDVAFPGYEKNKFTRDILLPLAGLDTTGIDTYFSALEIKGELNYVRNEVARGLLDGTMTETQAIEMLMDYGLNNKETAVKSIGFIRANRSYVINYNYGKDLVKHDIESKGGTAANPVRRWELFGKLLSKAAIPMELESGTPLKGK